jgi:hypothetical protein
MSLKGITIAFLAIMAMTHSVYAVENPPVKKPVVTKPAEKKQSLEIRKIKKKSNADKPTDASKLPKPKVKRLDVLAAEKAKK